MVDDVIGLVEGPPCLEALSLRDDFPVALPESRPEGRAPRHAPLRLVVAIVTCRVVDCGHTVCSGSIVARPQVAMYDARGDGPRPLEERTQTVCVPLHLVPHARELGAARALHLVVHAALAEEVHPLTRPRVELGGAANGVVHREAKLARSRLLVRGLGEVHTSHQTAKLLRVGAAPEVEVLHHHVTPTAGAVPVVDDLGDAHRVGVVHGAQAQCLALKHLLRGPARRLDEEVLGRAVGLDHTQAREGRPP
mmetsp:Transcript_19773/g.53295  ORF Transcript_19773/g.53295 Transcript_19773/m.53295 type:complete len:251 (-) Transcript_19773:202-954(-)